MSCDMKNTNGMSVYSKEYTFPMLLLLSDSYYSKTWLIQNYTLKFHDILNFSSYLTSQGRNIHTNLPGYFKNVDTL
jgi:hypothetical protein